MLGLPMGGEDQQPRTGSLRTPTHATSVTPTATTTATTSTQQQHQLQPNMYAVFHSSMLAD
jgi:hypothetical protein